MANQQANIVISATDRFSGVLINAAVRLEALNKQTAKVPDAGEVAAVQAYINALRPVTAVVTVAAPAAVPLNFTIDLVPDTAANRAAVEAELRDMLLREAAPGATILLSHIREAISLATGETDHILSVPAANVTHTTGQMATFGAITWV